VQQSEWLDQVAEGVTTYILKMIGTGSGDASSDRGGRVWNGLQCRIRIAHEAYQSLWHAAFAVKADIREI